MPENNESTVGETTEPVLRRSVPIDGGSGTKPPPKLGDPADTEDDGAETDGGAGVRPPPKQ